MAKDSEALRRHAEAPEEHSSTLSGARLRSRASLDLGTVLREVVDSARAP